MASLTDIVTERNKAYSDIWSIAQDALSSLKASSWASASPVRATADSLYYTPDPPDIKIHLMSPSPADIIQKIDDYIGQLKSVTPPKFPDDPNFVMLDHQVWADDFADKIKAGLSDYLDTMGIPSSVYQNAIFNEDYERNLVILNDLMDLADAKTGARGFSYTNDFGNGLKLDAQVKYQFDRTQVSRNISKLVTEWARENYHMAVKEGIDLEKAHMDFTYKYCTAFVSIYKDLVMALLGRYKAQVELLVAPIEALQKELTSVVDISRLYLDVDKTQEALVQNRSEIQIKEAMSKFETDAKVIISEFQQQMEQIRASANHAAGLAQATATSVIGYTNK